MQAPSSSQESLEFDDPHAANLLFGPRNAHLDILAAASGARLATCGAGLYIDTPDQIVRRRLCNLFLQLYELARGGMEISGQDVSRAYAMLTADPGVNLRQIYKEAVFVATPRKTVTARNLAQKTYLNLLRGHEMVFAVGPAGTGKTYLAVAMALNMLQQHKVKRIVLTRPAVEAGERLGFLPGRVPFYILVLASFQQVAARAGPNQPRPDTGIVRARHSRNRALSTRPRSASSLASSPKVLATRTVHLVLEERESVLERHAARDNVIFFPAGFRQNPGPGPGRRCNPGAKRANSSDIRTFRSRQICRSPRERQRLFS